MVQKVVVECENTRKDGELIEDARSVRSMSLDYFDK